MNKGFSWGNLRYMEILDTKCTWALLKHGNFSNHFKFQASRWQQYHRKGMIQIVLCGGFNFSVFSPYLGKWSNLTNVFQMGWNHHQLESHWNYQFVQICLAWKNRLLRFFPSISPHTYTDRPTPYTNIHDLLWTNMVRKKWSVTFFVMKQGDHQKQIKKWEWNFTPVFLC